VIDIERIKLIQKILAWILLIVVVLMVLSGYGITEFKIVEALTFGLLGKALSFSLHSALAIPFIILLLLHLYFTVIRKRLGKENDRGK